MIDVYAGTTEILTPKDAPTLELVCKLTEVKKDNKIFYKVKTSTKKLSMPGKKQVYRKHVSGRYIKDVIGLKGERISQSKELLLNYVKNGRETKKPESTDVIKGYYYGEVGKFNPQLKKVEKKFHYPVEISSKLNKLTNKAKKDIINLTKKNGLQERFKKDPAAYFIPSFHLYDDYPVVDTGYFFRSIS